MIKLWLNPSIDEFRLVKNSCISGESVIVLAENQNLLSLLIKEVEKDKNLGRILFYHLRNVEHISLIAKIFNDSEQPVVLLGDFNRSQFQPYAESFNLSLTSQRENSNQLVLSENDRRNFDKSSLAVLSIQINSYEMTSEFIDSVNGTTYKEKKIFIIDNYSTDYSGIRLILKYPEIFILNCLSRVSYCEAFNILGELASNLGYEYLFIVNNDTKNFDKNIFEVLIPNIKKNIGIVSPKIVDYEKKPIHWQPREFWGITFNIATEAYLIKTSLWNQVSGFNTRYVMYCEDLDLMLRLQKMNIEGSVIPEVSLDHLGGATVGKRIFIPTYFFLRNLLWVQKATRKIDRFAISIFLTEALLILKRTDDKKMLIRLVKTMKILVYVFLAFITGLILNSRNNPKHHVQKLICIRRNRIIFKLK